MAQYNVNNPAVKRIMREVKEMDAEPSDQYTASPLEDNIFEWHFTIRGPADTEFAGGLYHGRIILPPEYPFKPPNIVLLNPNGRFEVGTKICLSISSYHPEHWQPSWSIRTVLVALISFMPTKGDGAIGALDYPAAERRKLAAVTGAFTCEKCGKKLCNLFSQTPTSTLSTTTTTTTTTSSSPDENEEELRNSVNTGSRSRSGSEASANAQPNSSSSTPPLLQQPLPQIAVKQQPKEAVTQQPPEHVHEPPQSAPEPVQSAPHTGPPQPLFISRPSPTPMLDWFIIVLVVAILFLVVRKQLTKYEP